MLEKHNLKDKIIILKLFGVLEQGKHVDLDFSRVEDYVIQQGAFTFLRSTTKLHIPEPEFKVDFASADNLESQIIKRFEESNPNKHNSFISSLLKALQLEKIDDEKTSIFEDRLLSEVKKILKI